MPKKDDKELKVVNVRLVDAPSLYSDEVLDSPEAVSKLIAKEFKTYDREVCAVINLNVKLKPININICSIGTINTAFVSPREVFKSSILSNAAAFMLVHNHPSGDITPSREDKVLTKTLIDCGDLLNIKMIDHLIIGSGTGDIYSFKQEGIFDTLSSNINFDIRENRVMENINHEESYRIRKEISDVLENKVGIYESVLIRKETPLLLQKAGLQNKPILMSQHHIRNCLHEKGRNPHWHGLDIEFFEKLPSFLDSPAMLMDSFSDDYSVIAVFDVVDKDNLPIMASINTNGRGNYEFKAINSNYLTSIYGKERFDNFLKRTIEADFLLYANKEKTQTLSSCSTLQLREAIPQSFRFNTIIHKSGNIVNDDEIVEVKTLNKDKVYLNVHNNFAKIGLESKLGNGQTFNAVTIPNGSVVDGKDIGGGTIYPLDMYIYKNKFNDNLTTVQFRQDQEVQVNFKNGEHIKVKAEDLCEAVTKANKEYLDKNKNIEKSKIKEKNKDNEMDI